MYHYIITEQWPSLTPDLMQQINNSYSSLRRFLCRTKEHRPHSWVKLRSIAVSCHTEQVWHDCQDMSTTTIPVTAVFNSQHTGTVGLKPRNRHSNKALSEELNKINFLSCGQQPLPNSTLRSPYPCGPVLPNAVNWN